MTPLFIIIGYLVLLLTMATFSGKLFRGTSKDYFVASHSIGPFMLLMSVFGTTMTAFALVGSTGKAFENGIGTYGLMASSSGLIHAACFFVIGIKVWAIAKRHGYVTQIQFFRDRFESNGFGYFLFPILVVLVIPYLLIGVIGASKTIKGLTGPMFEGGLFDQGIPPSITGAVVCIVVLCYIFAGGSRAAAWANTFQTLVFMAMGLLAFILIANKLGGLEAAIQQAKDSHLVRTPDGKAGFSKATFVTYMFIPLSVGMFPHLFQHWLTAKSAKSFRLTVIMHPICIMIVWVPCVLIGVWATGLYDSSTISGTILAKMVSDQIGSPIIVGLVTAGILAAIMSSLDSQFLCLGTMFTNDVVLHNTKKQYSEKQIVLIARAFIVTIVLLTYVLSLVLFKQSVFDLAVWCFTGFAALTPIVFAALYWRGATKAGAFASVIVAMGFWFYYFQASGFGGPYSVKGVIPAAICWVAGAIALIVVSLFTKKPSEATIRKFFN